MLSMGYVRTYVAMYVSLTYIPVVLTGLVDIIVGMGETWDVTVTSKVVVSELKVTLLLPDSAVAVGLILGDLEISVVVDMIFTENVETYLLTEAVGLILWIVKVLTKELGTAVLTSSLWAGAIPVQLYSSTEATVTM